jgi:hypothetical protein
MKPWYTNEVTGMPIIPVEIERIRHFCEGKESLPGSVMLCGEEAPKDLKDNTGDVERTCSKCGNIVAEIRTPDPPRKENEPATAFDPITPLVELVSDYISSFVGQYPAEDIEKAKSLLKERK